jgi:hypothetical protein
MKHKSFTHISFTRFFLLIAVSIMLASLLTSCASFIKSEATFEGLYVTSFEVSVFYPCGMTEDIDDQGNKDLGYWLTSTPDSSFNEQMTRFSTLREPTGLRVYVKFIGVLSPTKPFGGYGHLGMYKNEVTITKVLEMKSWSDNLC